jgi:hypothetical protein
MKDITGREIKIGDILAVGQRSGNSGDLDIRVVAGFKEYEDRWRGTQTKIKTTIGSYLTDTGKTIIVSEDTFTGTDLEAMVKQELAKL